MCSSDLRISEISVTVNHHSGPLIHFGVSLTIDFAAFQRGDIAWDAKKPMRVRPVALGTGYGLGHGIGIFFVGTG